jgi:glycine hydroxymethyltransferase
MVSDVLDALAANPEGDRSVEAAVRERVQGLCRRFPIYG